MAKRIATGIDIGTYQIKIVVAEEGTGGSRSLPLILGTGFAESKGLRHGYIINAADLARSLKSALAEAERTSGYRIKKAYLSVGGIGLDEVRSRGESIISRADLTITEGDLSKAIETSEEKVAGKLVNRKVIHTIPLKFRVDGSEVLGRAENMKGTRVEADTLFVIALEQHLHDLITVVEECGVSVVDVMASPLAGSFVTLTKAQKVAGCALANIGAETTSVVVFENNIPISLKVFPVGSTNLTNDIALGLKVSLEEAEQIKLGALTATAYPKKKLDDIIATRLLHIFDLIEGHLKKLGKNELLPAGIILSGGGSGIATIEDFAKASLKLPSRRALLALKNNPKIKDSTWAVAYGLIIWGLSAEDEPAGVSVAKQASNRFINWLKQFLP